MTYYAEGEVVGTSAVGGDLDANPFYWGGDPGAPGEYADGLIDDVSLWSTALTGAQIALLAGGASPLALGGLAPLVTTDIAEAMLGVNSSVYVRVPFQVDDQATFNTLTLRAKYDDGFVAYLNGQELARRNAPAVVSWNTAATSGN